MRKWKLFRKHIQLLGFHLLSPRFQVIEVRRTRDLIRSHGILHRLWYGDVAHQVIDKAPCAVSGRAGGLAYNRAGRVVRSVPQVLPCRASGGLSYGCSSAMLCRYLPYAVVADRTAKPRSSSAVMNPFK